MMAPLRSPAPRFLLLLILSLAPMLHATAQVPPDPTAQSGMMIATMVRDLPATDTVAWLFRLTVPPGYRSLPTSLAGPALVAVESGQAGLATDSPVTRFSPTLDATPGSTDAGQAVLGAGEGARLDTGSTVTLTNPGTIPARLLFLYLVPAKPASPQVSASPTAAGNVEIQLLSAGHMDVTTSTAILIVELDIVGAGNAAVSSTHNGIEIGAVDQGSARVSFLSGRNWIWPDVMSTGGSDTGPRPIRKDGRVPLRAHDGYISIDGSLVWRAGENETLVVLRAQIIPVPVAE